MYSIQAVDGADALEKTKANKFDAIVTDIVMPKVDGITLTKELLERTLILKECKSWSNSSNSL